MKSKIIIGACAAVALALISTIYVFNNKLDGKVSENNPVSKSNSVKKYDSIQANFSEIRLSQDDLIKKSDLVVRCVFKGNKKTEERTHSTTGGDGKEHAIALPVTTYEMELVETLKGSASDKFNVVTVGGGNEYLETGDEYVLFLTYNKPYDTYTPLSYSQGLNIIKEKTSDSKNITVDSKATDASVSPDEELEIESAETNEVMNYKELKDKIKELEK